MVYAIESSRHLRVWLLLASLNSLANRKALAEEIIPLFEEEYISSTMEASTMNKSNRLKPSALNFGSVSPKSLRTLSPAKRTVKSRFESVRKLASGSGY